VPEECQGIVLTITVTEGNPANDQFDMDAVNLGLSWGCQGVVTEGCHGVVRGDRQGVVSVL